MTQHISTLMDGELDTHASEQAMQDCATPQGKQCWEIYHLIGEAMRAETRSDFDISERVMKAIDEQKVTVLAPGALKAKPKPAYSFARIALAAAASVATIGVVGWIGTQGVPGTASPAVAQSGITMQANVAVEQAKHQEPAKLRTEPAYAVIEQNDYLAAHRQQASPDQYRAVAARTPAQAR